MGKLQKALTSRYMKKGTNTVSFIQTLKKATLNPKKGTHTTKEQNGGCQELGEMYIKGHKPLAMRGVSSTELTHSMVLTVNCIVHLKFAESKS